GLLSTETGVSFETIAACRFGPSLGAGSALPKLVVLTFPSPLAPEPPSPGPAMPLPNPALATAPRVPLLPAVPLPEPDPSGRSKEPSFAMTEPLPVLLEFGGTPFGSPNPPV